MATPGWPRRWPGCSRALRAARPDLRWGGGERMDGDQPLGYADATGALAELADLDELTELSCRTTPAPASTTSTRS